MLRDVRSVVHLGEFRLRVSFEDGTSGEVDLAGHLTFQGIFSPLRDPAIFAAVRVDPDLGTICWPNGADIDPIVLHSWVFQTALANFTQDEVA